MIHIVLFDKPFHVDKISLNENLTFYELSYFEDFTPNLPKLPDNLITELTRRDRSHTNTLFLFAIISLHADAALIREFFKSNLKIDWGYIDLNGDTFLHKSCSDPQNAVFLEEIIQRVNTHNKELINHSNNAKQTPLALLAGYIYANTAYSIYGDTLKILVNNGAKIIVQKLTNQMRRPIMENFTIQRIEHKLPVITFNVQQAWKSTNYSMYAHISKPDEIHFIETRKLTSFSQEDFSSTIRGNFNSILDLNCPEILDYIFDPKNSLSKTNIDQSQTGESFLNIAARECNSPLLFEHFIKDITDWNLKNPNENILLISLSKNIYENFYLLLVTIPPEVLNQLLFTPNFQNMVPINCMIDIPNIVKCTQLIIKKGCLDPDGNNLAHFAILNKKIDFLKVVINCSEKLIFTRKNNDGSNPLHLAIRESSIEATHILLENSDRLILTSQNKYGYNCLHAAIIHFNIDIFKAVLGAVIKYDTANKDKIINLLTKKDKATTPFLLSIEKLSLEATELLLSSGASIDIRDYKSQYYPYYIQCFCRTMNDLQKVLRLTVTLRNSSTLKSECSIEDLNFEGSPLLFYFRRNCSLDRFKEICAAFSFRNVVKCNKEGNTILHLSLGNDNFTEYLLNLISDFYNDHKQETISFLDTINNKGETVLSLAVTASKHTAVQTILKLDASLNIEFPDGDNILHIAIRTKNEKTIAIFLCLPELGQLLCKPNDRNETPITSLLKSDSTGAINAITNVGGKDIQGPNGESILHLVVQNGDEQTLLELFKLEGFSWLDLRDKNQRTPLHYAVEFSKAYAIELLVKRGYNIFEDAGEKTPIHEAISRKNESVWREMFRILVSPNHSSQLPILLHFSIEMNNFNAMKDILTRKPNLTLDDDRNSIIHLAAKSPDKVAILKYLLQSLPKEQSDPMLTSFNKDKLTPLHYAVYHNNVEGARTLKEHGASIAVLFKGKLSFFSSIFTTQLVLYTTRSPNLTYLFGYSMKQRMENICILTEIPTFKFTHICKEGVLSRVSGLIPIQDLSLFLKSSCIDLISFIIRNNHVSLTYTNGITLLHYAAQFGTINIFNYLVETHKCNLFTLDKQNNSILYYALQNQADSLLKDVCKLIITTMSKTLSKQINLFETPNQEGKRILEICLDSGNIEGFKHLVEIVSDLLYFDRKGLTLLHHVINCDKREEFICMFIEKLNNLDKNLCTKCINCSDTDIHKLAPLHVAVFRGSNKIVNILLQNGAIPDVVDAYKKTALHYAVSRNIPEDKLIFSSLLKHPKLLQMKDQHGQTPIFYCIIENNVPALTLFIEHPINFHEEDKDGKTIMEYAIEKKSPEIWSIIFPEFCATLESKYIVTLTLKNLFLVCMKMDNEAAFTDLLGLKLCTTFLEQEWRHLIEFSITMTTNTFFLAQLITHFKTQKHLELYFYPKSNQFTPPLLVAIQRPNTEAIKLMLKENISLSFTRSDHCLTLYSENHSIPLVICKRLQDGAVLTGYKIGTSTMYLLVNLPNLDNTYIYEHSSVTELKYLTTSNLTHILKSPCIEPIKSVIDSHSRYTFNLKNGYTLIHLAAKVGSIEVLQYMLDKSSKIPELDQDRNSVLYYTLFNEITDIFKFLCDYLVDKLNNFKLFNCENAAGKRILDICIETDNLSPFCILLNPKYKVQLDYIDSRGYTLFHKLIIMKTSVEFFKRLHERTHSTHEYQYLSSTPVESSKLTSLHLAISENLHDHIEFMFEQKFDTCVQSKCGNYPIHVAVLKNLEKERMNKIILAIPKEKVTLVLNAQNNEGFTPLLLATRNGNACTVEALLERENIKIDTVDNLGRNALHHSILLKGDKFNLELLKLLLKHTTLIRQKDSNGLTSLHYCVIHDNTEALELVLQIDKDILNESKEKKNLIHFAIESTSIPVWRRVLEELKCSSDPKAIIERKLKGETILIYCIKQNNVTAFNDILTLTPDIEAIDSKGNTPLHRAAECPKQSKILTSLIEYIKEHCNDRLEQLFSTLNSENLAPFHYAIWRNNLSAIDIFMSHKAPFVIENDSKLTLCALNSPLSINLYSFAPNNQLMIGYKVVPESHNPPVWILCQIPNMKREAIKKVGNIPKIDKLTDLHIKTILQCPSAEPVIAFIKQKLIQESRKFENECSLLLYSAKYGTLSVVGELSRTMNLYLTDTNEETILFYAFCNKDTEVLKHVLDIVFKLSKQEPHPDILNAENKKGERILEVALNNFERFSILLDGKFKITLKYTNPNGYTLLHTIMGSKRDSKFLTILLKEIQTREPDYLDKYVNISSKEESTALHLCVSNNLEVNLRELLKFSPNITCEDGNGNTALHLASKLNFKSLVTILIEHVKSIEGDYPSFINAVNKMRMTPLHLSIISSNLEIAEELITAGAEIYATDDSGKTVLHLAVLITEEDKRNKAISFIFQQEKEKSDPERKLIQIQETSNNDSPLHLAVVRSNNKTIQLLLKESPDLTLCDVLKRSVLHLAITKGHLEIIESILNYITQVYPKDKTDPLHVLNLQDNDGNTALHIAIESSRGDILKELLPLNPLMNLKNSLGQTPLHIAVSKKESILKDVLDEISKYSEEEIYSYFYALDNTGLPPLHYAIEHNHLHSVETLISSGAGLACRENEQHTTLFNERNGLSLCFCRLKKNRLKKFLSKFTGYNIFVGYRMDDKKVWVVALLPALTQTSVHGDQDIEEQTDTLQEDNIMKSIIECESTEPIKAGILQGHIDDKKLTNNGDNWLKNFVISNKSHKNVRKFVVDLNSSTKDLCDMLKTGVENNDCFDVFEDVVESIPAIRDDPDSLDEDIREISRTLVDILSLSLKNDKTDALKKLLTLNPLLTHLYGENNDSTLLHLMVEKGKSSNFLGEYLGKVKIQEEQIPNIGKRIVDSKNSNSMTALNMSIELKQLNNIKTILSYQPDASLADASGNSSLHFAAKTGNFEIARLIIVYISDQNLTSLFDQKNSDGCTPLHLATESGSVEVCELLLEKDADRYSTDNISRTILHHAILIQDATKRKFMVEFILQITGNDNSKIVSMPDHQSCIPLQCAVAEKQVSVVELLVPFTDTIEHRNTDKQTALHLSCIHRCDEIVDLIVDQIMTHGEGSVINFKDKNSKTALHVSIDNKNDHALEKLLKAEPNLELLDASENTYLHAAVEVVDDPFFLRTVLTNLPEDSMKKLFTCLNSVELPPLQYAIMKRNYLAADILVRKGAKLDFQKQGKKRLCGDKDELKLQVVEYKSQCWVGFEILTAPKSHFVIIQLPSLEGDTYVSADDSWRVKPYDKASIKHVLQQICECKSSDPLNTLLQNGLISAETNFPQIAKFATIEVITMLFDNNKKALYHQDSGESMIESAVSNPNIDAFEFLLSKLPELQPKDVSSPNPTDSKDAQISLCVKNSLRKSLSNENTNVLNSLLKRFSKMNYVYPNEETLIHLAISLGKTPDFLKAIFEKVGKDGTEKEIDGVSFINKQSENNKQTALHICVEKKQKENLDILLKNSADPFLWDSQANTALHYSVQTNELHFVETIYNTTTEKDKLLQQTNTDNHSALHLSIIREDPEIVEFLLKASSPFYPVMDNEPTLLHLAIRINNESAQTEIMEQLFKHENAGLVKFPMTRLSDDKGYPPLHLATDLRNKNAVTLLLKVDPSVLYIQDVRGHTPLHVSLIPSTSGIKDENKDFSIFKTIFENIPAPCGENSDLPALNKDTLISLLYDKAPCCPFCQVNKVICTQDKEERTAMHYAVQHECLDAFKKLLATKSCLFITDEDGYTLQHEAVKKNIDIQFLIALEEELMRRTNGDHLKCFKFDTDLS